MKIFTTLSPSENSIEKQTEALNSWSSKFKVYSVNTLEDIEMMLDIYPQVEFIETNDTFIYKSRKLIKLNSILDSIVKVCEMSDFVAIVNSDIILEIKLSHLLSNKKYLADGLVISTRYEIDNGKIYPFTAGYDYFSFRVSNIDIYRNKNYVIGMPWWDYWFPLIAIKSGIKVYHIKSQIIFHRTHETNYDDEIWKWFGNLLYIDILIFLMKRPIDISIYEFCTVVKKFIESKHINIKIK